MHHHANLKSPLARLIVRPSPRTRERVCGERRPPKIHAMDRRSLGRWAARWIPAGIAAAVLMLSAYFLFVAPTVDQIFRRVADDHCPHLANGEPDRTDQDCYGAWGVNEVEAWDREHGAP